TTDRPRRRSPHRRPPRRPDRRTHPRAHASTALGTCLPTRRSPARTARSGRPPRATSPRRRATPRHGRPPTLSSEKPLRYPAPRKCLPARNHGLSTSLIIPCRTGTFANPSAVSRQVSRKIQARLEGESDHTAKEVPMSSKTDVRPTPSQRLGRGLKYSAIGPV